MAFLCARNLVSARSRVHCWRRRLLVRALWCRRVCVEPPSSSSGLLACRRPTSAHHTHTQDRRDDGRPNAAAAAAAEMNPHKHKCVRPSRRRLPPAAAARRRRRLADDPNRQRRPPSDRFVSALVSREGTGATRQSSTPFAAGSRGIRRNNDGYEQNNGRWASPAHTHSFSAALKHTARST
jgi:hypothetical protein